MSDESTPKREHKRTLLCLDVQVTQVGVESSAALVFETGDLSLGGVFLRSDLLLEVGEEIELSITLPGHGHAISARARVVWASRGANALRGAGMGVEFTQLTEFDTTALQKFLTAR